MRGHYLLKVLFLLLELLQVLLHDLQPGLVLRLYPTCILQGSFPFLILLCRELQGRGWGGGGQGLSLPWDRVPLCVSLFSFQGRTRMASGGM